MTNLTQAEIDERTALLKRFRSLLEQQRAKFREYLKVLESQEKTIVAEDTESLLAHTELEQQIASNIISLQKVIKPIEVINKILITVAKKQESKTIKICRILRLGKLCKNSTPNTIPNIVTIKNLTVTNPN